MTETNNTEPTTETTKKKMRKRTKVAIGLGVLVLIGALNPSDDKKDDNFKDGFEAGRAAASAPATSTTVALATTTTTAAPTTTTAAPTTTAVRRVVPVSDPKANSKDACDTFYGLLANPTASAMLVGAPLMAEQGEDGTSAVRESSQSFWDGIMAGNKNANDFSQMGIEMMIACADAGYAPPAGFGK